MKLIPQILAGDFGLLNHVGNRVLDLLQVVVPSVNVNILRGRNGKKMGMKSLKQEYCLVTELNK